jgi:hypothetical protein
MRRVLATLSLIGFLSAVCVFLGSFFGLTLDKLGAVTFMLHGGIFALFLAQFLSDKKLRPMNPYSAAPPFVRSIGAALGTIFVVVFIAFFLMSRAASPQVLNGEFVLNAHGKIVAHISEHEYLVLKGWELRIFATLWMFFYFTLMTGWLFGSPDTTP